MRPLLVLGLLLLCACGGDGGNDGNAGNDGNGGGNGAPPPASSPA